MAVDLQVPVVLPQAAADYGYSTATVYLEYADNASFTSASTASTATTDGTEHYEFDLSGVTTAHWYRARVGESDGSAYYDYLPAFQMPVAYATLQEVIRGRDFPDESRYDELDDLLVEATDYITTHVCGGRSFFRDPVGSGEGTATLDVTIPGQSHLSLARGDELDIISLSKVEVADYTGATYTEVASGSTGYYTLPDKARTGWPHTDLVLSDQGTTYTTFPTGHRVVRLTGVFGWSAVPDLVRRATVDLVRKWWEDRGQDGDPVGISAFGSPVFGPGMPKTVRDLARSRYSWLTHVG